MSYMNSELIMISGVLETWTLYGPVFFFSLVLCIFQSSYTPQLFKNAALLFYCAAPEILTKVRSFIQISISMIGEEIVNIQFSVHCSY